VHEAVIVRLSRFRTTRPAFDAVLRGTTLPDLRASAGVLGVFAGRQGPEEIGARLLVSIWSSDVAMRGATDRISDDHDSLADTTDRSVESLPAIVVQLAASVLATGILRVSRGGLRDTSLAKYAERVTRELGALQARGGGPADLVMAAIGDQGFVAITTWPDWSAIEAATGASVSEPLRTKRLATLDAFETDHYELVSEMTSAPE
jgi:hypothetical protein